MEACFVSAFVIIYDNVIWPIKYMVLFDFFIVAFYDYVGFTFKYRLAHFGPPRPEIKKSVEMNQKYL